MIFGLDLNSPRWIPLLPASAMLACAAAGWLMLAYVHQRHLSIEQEAELQRVDIANLQLQRSLDQLRDQTQMRLQQLNAENQHLREQLSELEQKLAVAPAAGLSTRENGARRSAAPAAVGEPVTEPVPATARPNNFSAPGWVPNYFSDESGPLRGTVAPRGGIGSDLHPRRSHRASKHRSTSRECMRRIKSTSSGACLTTAPTS